MASDNVATLLWVMACRRAGDVPKMAQCTYVYTSMNNMLTILKNAFVGEFGWKDACINLHRLHQLTLFISPLPIAQLSSDLAHIDKIINMLTVPVLLIWIKLNPAEISNYTHHKAWDEIYHPFHNVNGTAVEVWWWVDNLVSRFTGRICIHPC